MGAEFKADQVFDSNKMRHFLNKEGIVFHCHHYATLFSQLADDAKLIKGPLLMVQTTEETFFPILSKYYKENSIDSKEDRISIAEQYYGFIGLGEVKINIDDGTAQMPHAHVDEGWVKKWSKRDTPVNYIGQGYLAAAFAAITDNPIGSFQVDETESIVSGAASSQFTINKK